MNQIVSVGPEGPLIVELGEYIVGIVLTDTPDVVRVNGQPVRPDRDSSAYEWSKLPYYPIEVRRNKHKIEIQFRLCKDWLD